MSWQPIEIEPARPMNVLLYSSSVIWLNTVGEPVSFGLMRDELERFELGWWDGRAWRESGTGHEIFEPWRTQEDRPTHWMPLPAAPESAAP